MRTTYFPPNNSGVQIPDNPSDTDESDTVGSNSPRGHDTSFSIRGNGFKAEPDDEDILCRVLHDLIERIPKASRFIQHLKPELDMDLAKLCQEFEKLKSTKPFHLKLSVTDNFLSLLYLYQIVCLKIDGFVDGYGGQGKELILKELEICILALRHVQPAVLSGQAGKHPTMIRKDVEKICCDQGDVEEMAMKVIRQYTRIINDLSNREQMGTSVTFGSNNKGFQAGTLNGSLHGIQFGN